MPDITIIKLKIRRGTNAQRQTVILEQGELGYTIDTNRVFVGNGSTLGGTSIGTIAHTPTQTTGSRLALTTAVRGDIVSDNSLLFQLTGNNYTQASNWAFIGPKADENTLTYNTNRLSIRDGGITGTKFSDDAAMITGGIAVDPAQGLYVNVDNSTLAVNPTNNQLLVDVITEDNIASTALGDGIKGGNGVALSLDVNVNTFDISTSKLALCSIPNGIINRDAFATGVLGTGLNLDTSNVIKTVLTDVDNSTIEKDVNGIISLTDIGIGDTTVLFSEITYDKYGRVIGSSNTIIDTLSSFRTASNGLSVFNGNIEQTTFNNNTLLTVRKNDSTSVTLSSAGFISINTSYGQIAIPAFKY